MAAPAFVSLLNQQIGHEFAASQQYAAVAAHYDAEALPRLAAFFYRQAVEERNHAMMMVQYLIDADERPAFPALPAPQTEFGDIVAPVQLALDQEKRVADQVGELARVARDAGDYASEQFMQWFIKEQVEEIASMNDLLKIVTRAAGDPLRAEEFLAREQVGDTGAPDATAPPAAGGAL
jgi:ferritin